MLAPAVWANEWIRNAYAVGYPSWVEAIRALGVEGWVRKSNTLARFPAGFDPAFMDWYAKEVGKADVDVVTAMVGFRRRRRCQAVPAKITRRCSRCIRPAATSRPPTRKPRCANTSPSVRVTHLDTPYAMLGMLQPRACAEQILNFAAAHDGIVCRE